MQSKETELYLLEEELRPFYTAAIYSGNKKLETSGIEPQIRVLFSHNISLIRTLLGFKLTALPLSQADFAQLMGLAVPTVNKWENAIALPNRSVLSRLVHHVNTILTPRPHVQEADILYTCLIRVLLRDSAGEHYKTMLPDPSFGKEHVFVDFTIEGDSIRNNIAVIEPLPFVASSDILWDREWNEFSNPLELVRETGLPTTAIFCVKEESNNRFFDITVYPQTNDGFRCIGIEVTKRHHRYKLYKHKMDETTLRLADLTIDYQQQRLKTLDAQRAKERAEARCSILRSLTDNVSEILLVVDKQGTILEQNIHSIALFTQHNDIVGLNFIEVLRGYSQETEKLSELINKVSTSGFERTQLILNNLVYTITFSLIWAGGMEYSIVVLRQVKSPV